MNTNTVNPAVENVNEVVNAAANASESNVSTGGSTKKRRRGISNETQATSRKRFDDKDIQSNGLFVGHVDKVEVGFFNVTPETNGALAEFVGHALPRLTFTFASNHPDVTDRKYIDHTLFPIPSNVDTCETGNKSWMVDNMLKFVKHFMDVFYLKGRAMTDAEMDALELPLYDTDDNGMYVELEKEEVVKAYITFFTNVANFINKANAGNPVFVDDKQKFVTIWMKLLRSTKNTKTGEWSHIQKSGELSFPSFLGAGWFEVYKDGKQPSLSVNAINERVHYVEIAAKAPNAGGVMIGNGTSPVGGVQVGGQASFTGGSEQSFNAPAGFGAAPAGFGNAGAADDLPF